MFAKDEQMIRNPTYEMPGRWMKGRRPLWWESRSAAQTATLPPTHPPTGRAWRDTDSGLLDPLSSLLSVIADVLMALVFV